MSDGFGGADPSDHETSFDGDPHDYSPSQRSEAEKELQNIALAWNRYCDEITDGALAHGIHPPPALMRFYTGMLNHNQPLEFLEQYLPSGNEATDEHIQDTLIKIVSFGDMMFRFGQRCMMDGIVYGNLIPCTCGRVKGDTVEELLGTSGGNDSNSGS